MDEPLPGRASSSSQKAPFLFALRMSGGRETAGGMAGRFDERLALWVIDVGSDLVPLVCTDSPVARTHTATWKTGESSDSD